jgi:DNA-binding CsgD family transcriptional regulator
MDDDRRLIELIAQLYGGLVTSPPWEAFLRALGDATGATFATLVIGRGPSGIDAHVSPGADPQRTRQYCEISGDDPFVGLPEGRVVAFRDFVRHIPAPFRDWMDGAQTGPVLGVDLRREPDINVRLRLTRDRNWPDFGEAEAALVERLIPHLRIALDLHARLTTTAAESQLFGGAMADLAVATLILDHDGRVLRRNAMADRLLERGALALGPGDRLIAGTPSGATTLARLLADPPEPGAEQILVLTGPDGETLNARARAVPSSAYGDGARLALFLPDPARAHAPGSDLLRDRFQLTPAEAALAAQLAQGAALADAARLLGIAYNTARSHLRAIFAKTGTHRQVELVTLLRGSAGAFGA